MVEWLQLVTPNILTMATNYVPQSSREGQGLAQTFSATHPRVDASGVVEGIGKVETALKEEKAYKREIEALKQKERNAKIDALDESITSIQIPKLQYAGEQVVKDFWKNVNEGESFDDAYRGLTGNLSYLKNLSNNLVKEKPQILKGNFRYEDGTVVDGRAGFANLMEKGFNDKEREIYSQGGIEALGGSVMSNSSLMSEDFYEPSKHSFTEAINDYVVTKFGTDATETASAINLVGGKTGVQKERKFKSPKQIKEELKNNQEMFELFKRARTDAYRAEGKQGEIMEDYKNFIDNYKLPEETTVGYFTKNSTDRNGKNSTDRNGKGNITEEDLSVAKEVKVATNILQDNPSSPESKERINKFLAPYGLEVVTGKDLPKDEKKANEAEDSDIIFTDMKGNFKSGLIKLNDADAIYKFISKNAPEVKLDAVNQVEFEDPTPKEEETPKELKNDITLLVEGNDDVLSKFEGVEVERNSTSPDILRVDGKVFDITDNETAKEAFEYLEKRGYKKETTTREDLNAAEQERTNPQEEEIDLGF